MVDSRLVEQVRVVLDVHLQRGARVLVAVSGGADSGALALLTRRARPDLDVVGLHVRHGLRDDSADVRAATEVARRLGIGIDVRAVTVDRGPGCGDGPEGSARRARYGALAAAAVDHRAQAVLVGHTADDQAETVLLRLARGSGTRGLGAMAPARSLHAGGGDRGTSGDVLLLRPLLALRRSDVRAVLAVEGLPAVTDPTNADPDQRRARARAHALPALAGLAGGERDPVPMLCRVADHARADADALDQSAGEVATREVARWGPGSALRVEVIENLARAVGDRILRELLTPACGGLPSAAAVASARGLVAAGAGVVHVAGRAGGAGITCGGGWLAAAPLSARIRTRVLPAAPGEVVMEELGMRLRLAAEAVTTAPAAAAAADGPRPPGSRPATDAPLWVYRTGTSGDCEGPVLVLRAARAGDRMHRDGRSRRVAELLAGVPRALRPLVPVLADTAEPGAVRWVAGVGSSDEAAGTTDAGPAVTVGLEALR